MPKPYYRRGKQALLHGNSFRLLKELPADSISSVVTDPPYELKFMGNKWDSTGITYDVRFWQRVYRVMKPGAFLLAFGGTRTAHRLAVAIEDAGFEIRDSIIWIYGSGFPKSLDVLKAIYKEVGAIKAAKKWDGWGTALKPAHEPIVVARKPLAEKTVAKNVLRYGTGAMNINAGRIGWDEKSLANDTKRRQTAITDIRGGAYLKDGGAKAGVFTEHNKNSPTGRWPANVILSPKSAGELDRQMDASRFFYLAKASRSERGVGNNHPTVKPLKLLRYLVKMVTPPGGVCLDPFTGSGTTLVAAVYEDCKAIGIELKRSHCEIARGRLRGFVNA